MNFTKITFNYPTTEDRTNFFAKKMRNAQRVLDESIHSEELAKATEGQSFREMEKLWEEIIQNYLGTNQGMNKQFLLRIAASIEKEEEQTMFG